MTGTTSGPGETATLLLAGGQGERLHPLTRDRAKPAVPFGGAWRIVDFTLSNCLLSGLRRVYVLTQYKSLSLDRHLRTAWNVLSEEIGEFVVPVPPQMRLGASWYRGTADAIFQNIYTLEQERPRTVVVLSGDHVYKMHYGKMLAYHREKGADLTVACIEVPREEARHYGVAGVESDGRIREWSEKPPEPPAIPGHPDRSLASMGVYVFDTEVLVRRVSEDARMDSGHDFGHDVIPRMLARDRVFAWPFVDEDPGPEPYWRDIGRLDSYYGANLELLDDPPPFTVHDEAWPVRTAPRLAPPVRTARDAATGADGEILDSLVASGTVVRGGRLVRSVVGRDVRLRPGSEIEESVVMDSVVVGEGASVRRAIVDKLVEIPPGTRIGEDLERDAERFTVTESGIVIVPRGHRFRN